MGNIDSLSHDELCLLAIYTLFDTSESQVRKVRTVMEVLTGHPCNDYSQLVKSLDEKEFIYGTNYNWRTNNYDYVIEEKVMIPLMLYLKESQEKLVLQLLDAAKKRLQPTETQRLVWTYITRDFSGITPGEVRDAFVFNTNIDIFEPVIEDKRFADLLLMLDSADFFKLMNDFLFLVFMSEKLIDASYLMSLLSSYRGNVSDNSIYRLNCLLDLYNYMARGIKPHDLLANNKNHRIIAALDEAYHGNMRKALEHFKQAVALNNKDGRGYVSSSKSYLPLELANFFYVLVAYMSDSEDGRKKCVAVTRIAENQQTRAARILYNILSNTFTEKKIDTNLCELLQSSSLMERSLAVLMCSYLGKEKLVSEVFDNVDAVSPKWLILRHEIRKYKQLGDLTVADKAYGNNGLLSQVYHKQQWENVLDELIGIQLGNTPETQKQKSVRIGYFVNDLSSHFIEIRQQSMLKSGTWGAGKRVSLINFFEGSIEGMTEADRRIAMKVNSRMSLTPDIMLEDVLPEMTEESRLYVGDYAPYSLVQVTEEMPYLTLERTDDGFSIVSNVPADEVDYDIIITHQGAASVNFIQIPEEQKPYYRRLLSLDHFPLEAEEQLRTFLKALGNKVEVNSDLIEGGSTLPVTDGSPMLIMQMRPKGRDMYEASLFVRPLEGGKIRSVPAFGNEVIVDYNDNGRTRVKRDMAKENENIEHLISHCSETPSVIAELTSCTAAELDAYDLLPLVEYAQQNQDRITCEWPEGSRMKVRQRTQTASWTGAIKKNENGWFEIEGSVEIDEGRVLTMTQLLDLTSQARGRFIKLSDGEFLSLSDKLRKQLNSLSFIASRSKGKLIMSPFAVALLGTDMTEGELMLTEDEEVKQIRKKIKSASRYSPEVPAELNATLRKYQKDGYQWMSRLNNWGAGALLADDMGLGKTIQTITFLLSKKDEGPSLVIAPASVAPNWKTEFSKFAPSLNVTMLNFSPDRREVIKNAKAGDVVVTTYGLLLSVKDYITKKTWTTICLDEAHIIKNRGAKTSAVAMQLKSQNRVMLTGTPVQNHLGELWNLFQFVNPGLLGSFEDFNRRFIIPIEQNGDKQAQENLDRLIKPFMLRRTKDKVAKELPEKEEIYQHVDLSDEELLIYEAMRRRAEQMLLEEPGGKVSMSTLAEITRLRQCACDIRLVEEGKNNKSQRQGSKIIALVELLQTILEGNAAALVFSQFTSYLSLIKKALDEASIPYLYIDGAVPIKERQRLVEKFQAGECPVFLISLKAGGLGLNLTRANYVVHMDPWWNPAIEAQATDRAHRIGQKQNVTVYHLIAEATIEEKIQRMHEQKRELVENILESTDMSYKLTGEELLKLVHS